MVQRIFAEFLAGTGIYAIAERLTAEGIPRPSAYDPDRNRHRCGTAWSKYAIRAILTNPRYTGRQVWNRQRKDEVLIDVHDVALGHTTKMRWNEQGKWIYCEEIASVVSSLSDLLAVLRAADPADKAEIYAQLGLRLTYHPSDRTVWAEAHISPAQHWQFESVRGRSWPLRTCSGAAGTSGDEVTRAW